jgi:hypothetical protein
MIESGPADESSTRPRHHKTLDYRGHRYRHGLWCAISAFFQVKEPALSQNLSQAFLMPKKQKGQ